MTVGKYPPNAKRTVVKRAGTTPVETNFAEVVSLIEQARNRAYQAANTELVGLYWRIGKYISSKLEAAEWGEGVIDQLVLHLAQRFPGLRGFARPNLFRMRQFYETYARDKTVSSLVTQLPWTHNLIILAQSKRPEEREFYVRMGFRSAGANVNWSNSFGKRFSSARYCIRQKSHHW